MAAFLTLHDKSCYSFWLGEKPAAIIAAALPGVHELYLDGDELTRAKNIIESHGLSYYYSGNSKKILANTRSTRALIALIITNWE